MVISGVISPLIWVIVIATLLITPLIITHEPPRSLAGGAWRATLCRTRICLAPRGLEALSLSTAKLGFGVPYFNPFFLKEPL